jgi:hypothetical protein
MNLKILGAAAAFVLAAEHGLAWQVSGTGQSIFCATREAGNPYSKYCDYMGWSSWRRRGAWDSSLDNACSLNPHYVPPGCFPFQTPPASGY